MMKLICPVCETDNEGGLTCRQCSADLGPLARVSQLPEQYCREGMRLLDEGNTESALERLTVATSLLPQSAEAHAALSRAYAQKGMYAEALRHCVQAQQLAPERQDLVAAREALQKQQSASSKSGGGLQRSWLPWALPALAAVVIVSLAFVLPKTPAPPPPQPPDLVALVRQHLESHSQTQGLNLSITQEGGVVHISGHVPSEEQLRAVRESATLSAGDKVDLHGLTASPPPPPARYRVRPGDTLSLIAKREYGNAELWRKIQRANKGHSEELHIGEQLDLPALTLRPRAAGNE